VPSKGHPPISDRGVDVRIRNPFVPGEHATYHLGDSRIRPGNPPGHRHLDIVDHIVYRCHLVGGFLRREFLGIAPHGPRQRHDPSVDFHPDLFLPDTRIPLELVQHHVLSQGT
jgi:hypothetical protein